MLCFDVLCSGVVLYHVMLMFLLFMLCSGVTKSYNILRGVRQSYDYLSKYYDDPLCSGMQYIGQT